MKKVFLEELPKKMGFGANANKECIDWNKSVGYKVKFMYDDIEGEAEIINQYKKSGQNYLEVEYNDRIVHINAYAFSTCTIGNLLSKVVTGYRHNIGDIINLKFSDIQILEKIKIPNGKNIVKGYTYKCTKCGNEDKVRENDLNSGKGCNVCCVPSKKILIGYNDLWTTHPNIAKLLKDPQEGYEITQGSDKYKTYICQDCGYEKSYVPHNLIVFGFSCPRCGDKISFGNKVGFSLLEQLGVDFIPEYNFHDYRFDFYFEFNNVKYDLEMDGRLGHGNYNTLNNMSAEETKEKDEIRDCFSNEHGIEVIRIDCLKSNLNYIKENIMNSKLNDLFDLSIIDWGKCEEYIDKVSIKTACDHWNSGIKSSPKIAKVMGLSNTTVVSYLNRGVELELCDYNKNKRKIIQLSKDNEFIKEWNGIAETERELNINNISYCCWKHNNDKTAGGFKWMYKEDYEAMSSQPRIN